MQDKVQGSQESLSSCLKAHGSDMTLVNFPWTILGSLTQKPCCSDGKESACNAGYLGPIPWLERSSGEGNGYPLQYSCLENSMDKLAGYSLWGHKELDTTEQLTLPGILA